MSARRRRKAAKRYLVYLLARALTAPLFLLPTSWVIGLGAAAGWLASWLATPLMRRARGQLEAALGVDPHRATQLARAAFASAGRVGAEIVLLPRLLRDVRGYVMLPEPDRAALAEAMAAGQGVVVVTAHLGCWELLAQRLAAEGYPAATLARRSPNPYLGRWLVARRAAGGLETLNRGGPEAIRGMLAALRRGALLGVLIDQDTKVDSVHVPFFGRPAATPVAAASLALRRRLPVLAVFIRRRADGPGHVLSVSRVPLPEAGDREAQTEALTAALTARIEAAVRTAPTEWVWFHDRWRTPAVDAPRRPESNPAVRAMLLPLLLLCAAPFDPAAVKADKGPVQMSAQGGIQVDLKRRVGVAKGDVIIRRSDVTVCCDEAEAEYEADRIRKVTCRGNVVIRRPDGTVAVANEAIFQADANAVTLSGDAKVFTKDARLAGPRIVYDINKDALSVAGGTSRFSFDPKGRELPKGLRPCPGPEP